MDLNKTDRPASATKWHNLIPEAVLEKLSVSEKGLGSEEAERRKERYGYNKLPEPETESALQRFLYQFHNVLIYVLLAAAAITALLDHWIDTWVILAVVLTNAFIGFLQEGKAQKALESIRKMLSLHTSVVRDGRQQKVDAADLVPGDIVQLESGDRIPADMRLISLRNFRVEESALTGESEPAEKQLDPVPADSVPGDRTCMVFSGTSVVHGRASAVVVETGTKTELGKINRMMAEVEQLTTPLLRKIDSFGKSLSVVILLVTVLFFSIGYYFHDYETDELFLAVISLAVAAIPEGLPAIMTITLAVGVQAMARQNAIIRRLPSIETLGSVTVICSDKTGTLTKNEMTAREIQTVDTVYEVEGAGYLPKGDILLGGEAVDADREPVLQDLLKAVRVCNDASLYEDDQEWKMYGDPTEGALISLGYKAGLQFYQPERIDHIPFESEHRYMATLNEINGTPAIYVKGAPERLLEICSHQRTNEGDVPINQEFWKKKMDHQAGQGRRLIAAAIRECGQDIRQINHEDINNELIFLGIIGIIDPPRPEAVEAIRTCRDAGIRVKMITGDHLETARAIGLELGIGDGQRALSGASLEGMDDHQLKHASLEYDVFARTSPEHKLRLVKGLQEEGTICAMTGDGVNDAPALKRADVGIAMGIKGTEVTKDASEMVLADDNFATIANAVKEGRTIYDNLRKAILFILPTNGAESLVVMIAMLIGIALPITPVQILWVNMVTAITLALALSFEPTEPGVMKRPPRDPGAPMLGGYFLWRIFFVSILIGGITFAMHAWLIGNGYDIDTSRTIAVNILVTGQLFYLFNCRRMYSPAIDKGFFNNRYAFGAAGVLIVLQMIFTYAPFMNLWFGTDAHEFSYWIYPLAGGLIIFFMVELEKWLIGRFKDRNNK